MNCLLSHDLCLYHTGQSYTLLWIFLESEAAGVTAEENNISSGQRVNMSKTQHAEVCFPLSEDCLRLATLIVLLAAPLHVCDC